MHWGYQCSMLSALFFITGLSVVQSRKENVEQNNLDVEQQKNGNNMDKGAVTGSTNVNGSFLVEPHLSHSIAPAIPNVTSIGEPKEVTLNDARLEPLSVKVLHGESDALSISDMSDTSNRRIPSLLKQINISIYSVDFHWSKGLIFFAAGKKIYRARILGKQALTETQLIANSTQAARIAVDWVHDRLYWMSDKYHTVEVADLDGSNRTLIIDNVKPFKHPNNVVVDPYAKVLFFVSDYCVFKSSLDGSHVERVVLDYNKRGERARGVRCIALDRNHRKLYLTGENPRDPETNVSSTYIARTNYDGTKMVDLDGAAKAHNWSDIFGIDVFRDTLYIANYDMNNTVHPDSLWTVGLKTNRAEKRFVPRSRKSVLWSIRVYHPLVQKAPEEEATNGQI